MKKIRKSFWRAYWKLHDKKKMLVARLKGYLDGLPPKTRKRIVLAMLAAFAVLALYTFGKAVYDIGRNDGSRIVTDHAGQVELSVKPDNNHNVIPYLYVYMEQTKNEPKNENKAAPDNGKPKNRRQAESHQACLNGQGAKEEGKAKERKPLTEAQRLKRQKMIVLPLWYWYLSGLCG